MTWAIVAERHFDFDGPSVRMAQFIDGRIHEVTDITFEVRTEGTVSTAIPVLRGPDAAAFLQAAMDAAYEFGLRPSRAQDEKHQRSHLEDMRKIAFQLLDAKA